MLSDYYLFSATVPMGFQSNDASENWLSYAQIFIALCYYGNCLLPVNLDFEELCAMGHFVS